MTEQAKDLSPEQVQQVIAEIDRRQRSAGRNPLATAIGLGVVIFVAVILALYAHTEYVKSQIEHERKEREAKALEREIKERLK